MDITLEEFSLGRVSKDTEYSTLYAFSVQVSYDLPIYSVKHEFPHIVVDYEVSTLITLISMAKVQEPIQ